MGVIFGAILSVLLFGFWAVNVMLDIALIVDFVDLQKNYDGLKCCQNCYHNWDVENPCGDSGNMKVCKKWKMAE